MRDRWAIGRCWGGRCAALGLVEGSRENFERSEALQREALAIFSELGNEREIRESLGMLKDPALARGDLVSARAAIEEAL